MTSCMLPWITKLFKNGSTLKGNKLLSGEQILLRVDRHCEGRQNQKGRIASPESVPVHFKTVTL